MFLFYYTGTMAARTSTAPPLIDYRYNIWGDRLDDELGGISDGTVNAKAGTLSLGPNVHTGGNLTVGGVIRLADGQSDGPLVKANGGIMYVSSDTAVVVGSLLGGSGTIMVQPDLVSISSAPIYMPDLATLSQTIGDSALVHRDSDGLVGLRSLMSWSGRRSVSVGAGVTSSGIAAFNITDTDRVSTNSLFWTATQVGDVVTLNFSIVVPDQTRGLIIQLGNFKVGNDGALAGLPAADAVTGTSGGLTSPPCGGRVFVLNDNELIVPLGGPTTDDEATVISGSIWYVAKSPLGAAARVVIP